MCIIRSVTGCSPNEEQCGNSTDCVPLGQMCDGIRDCTNGEDERNCCEYNYTLH